jgi:surface carbohydrate biosynthesis protein
MKKVLLVVDNPHREMRGMVGIWIRLRKKGCLVHIVSKTTFNDWYMLFQPDAVVLPRATSELKSFVKEHHLQTKIIVIPSEHGSGFEQKVLNNAFGADYWDKGQSDSAIELASLILVGGENQNKWLRKAMPVQVRKIKVVGTLSSDHWLKPKSNKNPSQKIGICTTFKSMFLSTSNTSVHKLLYEHFSPNYDDNRWRLNFQNYELHYLSVVFEAIDRLTSSGNYVDVRPHPHEYWPGWKRWRKSALNKDKISLNRDIDLANWIDSNAACITSFSTTSLDCIVRDVPAISLEKLVEDEVQRVPEIKTPLMGEYSWKPSTLTEMMLLIDKANRGELDASPNIKSAEDFIEANFHWPREKSSATFCADEIFDLIDNSYQPGKRSLTRLIKIPVAIVKIIGKEIRDFIGPRRSNLLFSFSFRIWYRSFQFNKDIDV